MQKTVWSENSLNTKEKRLKRTEYGEAWWKAVWTKDVGNKDAAVVPFGREGTHHH